MNTFNKIVRILTIIALSISLYSCAKPDWSKPAEPSGKKRAQQNVRDGKGVIFDLSRGGKSGGDFLFASSNPLWRASLETIDFMPLTTVDYSGGIIITDWYTEDTSSNSIKISVRFLDNEIRADSLKIIVHKKDCSSNNNCKVNLLSTSTIGKELRTAIVTKAAEFNTVSKNKKK